MIRRRFSEILASGERTLLGVGPMSRNCVDATVALAAKHDVPVMLIASRRQIDSEEFGGGYVNRWDTASLARYVSETDRRGNIILSRDHGGPWQNPLEVAQKMDLAAAMRSAKLSYERDIENGFSIIHVDPSLDPNLESGSAPGVDQVLERVFELCEFCCETAVRLGKEILIEVGAEEQKNHANSLEELHYFASRLKAFVARNRLPAPSFIVVQTGTRVVETRNVGELQAWFEASGAPMRSQIEALLKATAEHGLWIKQHNTDYLPYSILELHPRLGIHSANVAPEFGVVETRALVQIAREYDQPFLEETLLRVSFASRKWEKWMVPATTASDFERAVIAAHYVFSHPEVEEARARAAADLRRKNVDLEAFVLRAVEECIEKYMKAFRLI